MCYFHQVPEVTRRLEMDAYVLDAPFSADFLPDPRYVEERGGPAPKRVRKRQMPDKIPGIKKPVSAYGHFLAEVVWRSGQGAVWGV